MQSSISCFKKETDEGNDIIKLKEAAETKIHAFIQMLGADAKLLTEGEEIVSHEIYYSLPRAKNSVIVSRLHAGEG